MKQLYPLFLFLFITQTVFCQLIAPDIQWQKSIGTSSYDNARKGISTSDGGSICVGSSDGSNFDITGTHGGTDALVVKYSSAGIVEWKKLYGGSSGDSFRDIIQTSDGGYIAVGTTSSTDQDVVGIHGINESDGWVVKINSTGTIEWQRCYGSYGHDDLNFIVAVADGYLVAGNAEQDGGDVIGNHGNADGWVVKINTSGIIQWQKCYGGSNTDAFRSIKQNSDGGFILGGLTFSNDGDVSGYHSGSGGPDAFVVRINNIGDTLFVKALGGSNNDVVNEIQETPDGGFVFVGYTNSSNGDAGPVHQTIPASGFPPNDIWVVKLNSTGILNWQKCFGGAKNDDGNSFYVSSTGDYIVGGTTTSNDGEVDLSQRKGLTDGWILCLNTAGGIRWQKIIGTSKDDGLEVNIASDGGALVYGSNGIADGDASGNTYRGGSGDFWLVKLATLPIPVTLINFNAAWLVDDVKLNWQTSAELNSGYFEIQKSNDGIRFNAIGKVNAKGNSSTISSYSFIDKQAVSVNYYRLKIIDINGSFVYSDIKKVIRSVNVHISPNPVLNVLHITGNVKSYKLYNGTGNLMMDEVCNTCDQINMQHLPKGVYLLVTEGNDLTTKSFKVFKQ